MATTAQPDTATTSETTARPTTAKAWGTEAPDQPLKPMEIERRPLRPDDVAIKISWAGICHSDLLSSYAPIVLGYPLNVVFA